MSIFLSKADTRKLLLLHIIEESFQQQITISELKKRMEVSEFIVISAYEELKEDIKNYRLSDQIAIQKFNKILKIKRTMNFSSKSLRSIYIQRSLNFQIIEDIFEEKFSKGGQMLAGIKFCEATYSNIYVRRGSDTMATHNESEGRCFPRSDDFSSEIQPLAN